MQLGRTLTGLVLLGALWAGPLPQLAEVSMTAAMVLHLGVVAVAPALIAVPLPLAGRPAAIAAATVIEAAVVWGWHAPEAHAWARLTTAGLVLEQASFLACGLLLWSAVRAAGRFGGAAALLGTMMHMTLLGALIALAPRQLFIACGGGPLGLSPLEDQQVAGTLMAAGACIYLVAGLVRLSPALALELDARRR